MYFEIITPIAKTEIIASGAGVRLSSLLRKQYGFLIKLMAIEHKQTSTRFAVCVMTDDPDLLTPRMVYQVLPDDDASKSGYLRIVDNEGEDYLYPARYFLLVDFPQPVRQALLHARVPLMRSVDLESIA